MLLHNSKDILRCHWETAMYPKAQKHATLTKEGRVPKASRDMVARATTNQRQLPPLGQAHGGPKKTSMNLHKQKSHRTLPPISNQHLDSETLKTLRSLMKPVLSLDHGPGTPSSPENEVKICKRYHVALAEEDLMKQSIALQQLGDLHCQRARDATVKDDVFNVDGTDDVLKAVAAYTAALVRTNHLDQRQSLTQRLKETEAMYIDLFKHSVFSRTSLKMEGVQMIPSHHGNPVDKYVRKMDKFREFIRKRLNKVQDMWKHKFVSQERGTAKGHDWEVLKESMNLSNKVRQEMKTLFRDIVLDCIMKLGEPPCKYAIVGVGDIALNYATPYSDFQYVILTKSSDLEAKEYFKYLANLIYIQVLLLGETPLTATLLKLIQDPFNRMIRNVMDEHSPQGIKIDISWTSTSINPFLFKYSKHIDECDQDVDLIKTPADMIRFVYMLHDKGLYQFAFKMYQTMLIVGDNDIFFEYRDMVEDYFIPKQFNQEGRIQSDSANLLTEITGYFDIDFYVELNRNHTNMALYNITKDLKMTAALIYMLKVVFCLSGKSQLAIIEEMKQNGYVGDEGEVELKTLACVSYYLHLRSFSQQNGQRLAKSLLTCKPDSEEMVNVVNVVFCDQMPGVFLRYYTILVPLLRGLKQFHTSEDKRSVIKTQFQKTDILLSYYGYSRLAQYKEALVAAKQFVHERDLGSLSPMERFEMFNDLGLIALKCRNTKEANTFFTHAMETKDMIEHEESKVYAFITTWHNMGLVHLVDERFSKATTFFEESLTMGQEMGGSQIFKSSKGRQFTAMVYTSIAMVKLEATSFQEAERFQQKAIETLAKVKRPNLKIIWWQRNLTFDLANLKVQLGKFKESLGLLKTITDFDTSLSELHSPQLFFASTLNFVTSVVKSMGKATLVDLYSMYSNRMITTVLGTTFSDLEPEAFSDCELQQLLILLRLYRDITFREDHKKCMKVSKLILNLHESSAYERLVSNVGAAWDYFNHAKILTTMEAHDEALDSVTTALALIEKPFGENENIMRALLLKSKGVCLLNKDNAEDALRQFQMSYSAFKHALLKIRIPEQIEILEHIAEANKRLRIYDEAVKSWEECISFRKQIFGPVHLKVAYSLRKLGLLLQEMMEYDSAVTCIQQSLEMYKRVHGHGKNHKDVAQLHFDLGRLYCDILEPDKAEHSLVKALEIRRFLFSANPHQKDMIDILQCLGNFYRTETRIDEAITLHKEAIESGLIVYCLKSKNLAKIYASLGEDYQALENYEDSSRSFETAVEIYRNDVGIKNDNLEVANWLRELGRAYEVMGIRDKASQCHKRSLEIKEQHMGKEAADADLLDSLYRLAERHESKGDYKRAIPLRKQFLLKQKQISGDEPSSAKCGALKALSRSYLKIGEHEYAQGYNTQLLQMLRDMHGDNPPHPAIAEAVHNAGFIYDTMGRVPKAIKLYREALMMYQALDTQGDFKELIGIAMTDLGNSMNSAGQQEAVDVLQSSVNILESVTLMGEKRLLLAKAIHCLGVAYEVHPKYEMAVKNHKQALAIREELAIEGYQDNVQVAESLRALGRSFCQLGRYLEGIPLLENSYLHVRTIHAKEKKIVIEDAHALVELGQAHAGSGNAEEAICKYSEALEIMRQVYGKEKAHLQVANCLSLMAEAAKSTKERQTAIELAHQSMDMYKVVLRHVHDHPIYPHLTALIAEVHMSSGQYTEAVAFYTKAAQLYLSLHQGNALTLDVQRNMSKLREAKKILQLSNEATVKKQSQKIPSK